MDHLQPAVFDGHNDVLTRILMAGGVSAAESFLTGRDGQVDLPKARSGGFGGGFFAIWVPSPSSAPTSNGRMSHEEQMQQPTYELPLDGRMNQRDALSVALEEVAILLRLEELGALKICTTVAQIRDCLASGVLAAVLHIEGAEAIDESFHSLDVLYRAGLRSLGPVWSRPTAYGEGVPFRFPSSPDIGGGLTSSGVALVQRCNRMGILLDLSHLNEAGFWDVAKHSTHPLVATHSNAHVLCQHARNLTDKQLAAIAESDGIVGLNFAAAFLREDGQMRSDVPLALLIRQLDHLMDVLGEDGVGLGSDFDGATVPEKIKDVSGLPALRQVMRDHGYNDALMLKLCHGNWLRILERTWGEQADRTAAL